MPPNRLYFGDCLDVMREDVPDRSVDLIYLDPPFNSKRLYNAYMGGAQWVAFDDTWRWHEAVDDFHEVAGIVEMAGTMEGLRQILGEGPNMAYLSYMANRMMECRRVLADSGSIYLHCDPTMSHYLKVVMDAIFGRKNFRNEIVWYYKNASRGKRQLAKAHDIVFWYSMSDDYQFHRERILVPFESGMTEWRYTRGGQQGQPMPVGKTPDDVVEMPSLNAMAKERVGYPTQKPLSLLERIIKTSSNEGDRVMDPFCGCGTTLHAAQALDRRWTGIDICVNACKVIEKRLTSSFDSIWSDVEFIGMPKTADDARTLAEIDAFRFERWAASLVDGMEANKKQRGDRGIDGRGRIPVRKGQFIDVVSQVKGGHTNPGAVQAFNGARQEAGADLGIFICFADRVTTRMRDAAANAGRFMDVPVVQIYTIEDYFEGRYPQLPRAI